MEYRKLPHGTEQISVIGLGTSVVGEHSVQNVVETVTFALDSGVNVRTTCRNLRHQVRYQVQHTCGVPVGTINIYVETVKA